MTTPTLYNADVRDGAYRQHEGAIADNATVTAFEPLCLIPPGDGTSANRGRVIAYDGEDNRLFLGFTRVDTGTKTGDTNGTVRTLAVANGQSINLAISGITAATGNGRDVWCDEAAGVYTYSVTPPAVDVRAIKVGKVVDVPSTGIATVQTPMGDLSDQSVPTHAVLPIGTFVFSGTNTTKTLMTVPVPFHGLLIDAFYRPHVAPAGASATSTISFLRVPNGDGTPGTPVAVTNGGITAATGDTVNVEVYAGTAPSAANEFWRGDGIRVSQLITADGTFSAGEGTVYGIFAILPGQ